MNKNWLAVMLATCLTVTASSQTLFTYGDDKVDAKEFLKAFNKNNPDEGKTVKMKALQEYLDLYINSRLKIKEAYDRRYDTLPQIKSEVDNLRSQIIETYMSDPETIERLSKEAQQRSLKDIHAAHIFISYNTPNGEFDTLAAKKKLAEVTQRLQNGEEFLSVAQKFSDDPSASTNKGDLSWLTVFSLPYEFENIVYATAPGKYLAPYRSKIGFHIFKVLAERKAVGKIKAQQILLAFAPGATTVDKKRIASLSDSLYKRILAGDDFGKLAATYSNDYISAASGGNMPDISVGQFDPVFENALWSLQKNGAVSKPFITSHGYHIVKRVSVKPIITDSKDKNMLDELRQKIMQDDRWKTAKDFIYAAVRSKAGYKKAEYNDAALWALTDSLLDRKNLKPGNTMTAGSQLFKIGDNAFTVQDWSLYATAYRYKADRSGLKSYPDLMDEFTKQSLYQYYRDHLEDFNEGFRYQMNEFRDGNLFFEIMQQEVWNKAQSDSTALLSLYEQKKSSYNWKQSADAIIFFCSDAATATTLLQALKKNPAGWKQTSEKMNEKVVADSSRYEWPQLPGLGKAIPKAQSFTTPAVNPSDNTASFALIVKVYEQPSPRNFNEAKGLVMNDYQMILEEKWIKDLKKKYPVKINQQVLSSLL
jgi:peptidyl-prolyl cis-trans isomerase SurA